MTSHYPDTKDIVNVACVGEELGGVFREYAVFMDGEE